ncbi:MAG: hypothetical protein LW832_01015 [Parachlamydia sp.]|jgi:hypothetical protein|nr:hypothetical protein [Parachlamydia sp.]
MENKFIPEVCWLAVGLSIIASTAACMTFNVISAASILAGTGWGCLNLYFLKKFLEEYLKGSAREYLSCYTWMLIKFPLLYLFGFGLLKLKVFSLLGLTAGFSLIFASMFLMGVKSVINFKRAL